MPTDSFVFCTPTMLELRGNIINCHTIIDKENKLRKVGASIVAIVMALIELDADIRRKNHPIHTGSPSEHTQLHDHRWLEVWAKARSNHRPNKSKDYCCCMQLIQQGCRQKEMQIQVSLPKFCQTLLIWIGKKNDSMTIFVHNCVFNMVLVFLSPNGKDFQFITWIIVIWCIHIIANIVLRMHTMFEAMAPPHLFQLIVIKAHANKFNSLIFTILLETISRHSFFTMSTLILVALFAPKIKLTSARYFHLSFVPPSKKCTSPISSMLGITAFSTSFLLPGSIILSLLYAFLMQLSAPQVLTPHKLSALQSLYPGPSTVLLLSFYRIFQGDVIITSLIK